ncbi:hypothetical protein MAPG_04846 [Magnaporthiopsis poae ATCC 64411]|uniref:Uncharacterized protein n=1 Tax=Magnaporthiopsis poae (strain ATCC 64411 / 73-15) TaxID=644358 RepID=A0A0C4DXT9_MAGP6|nr:hypothetical protein MAPG_04846 [Magnaporthiopsis poae ATCC 64411]
MCRGVRTCTGERLVLAEVVARISRGIPGASLVRSKTGDLPPLDLGKGRRVQGEPVPHLVASFVVRAAGSTSRCRSSREAPDYAPVVLPWLLTSPWRQMLGLSGRLGELLLQVAGLVYDVSDDALADAVASVRAAPPPSTGSAPNESTKFMVAHTVFHASGNRAYSTGHRDQFEGDFSMVPASLVTSPRSRHRPNGNSGLHRAAGWAFGYGYVAAIWICWYLYQQAATPGEHRGGDR